MRILSFDPGATRAGWTVLDGGSEGYALVDSGVEKHPRGKMKFQPYRMFLCEWWMQCSYAQLMKYEPQIIVSETVPSRGPEIMDQLYLANVMITTVHAMTFAFGKEVVQVSARTVQAAIAKRKEGVKVTKTQVRNGVTERLPEIDYLIAEDMKEKPQVFERSDAAAVGIWYLDQIYR